MINIYDKAETNFNTNGLGILNNCTNASIANKLNDAYELSISYPLADKKLQYLKDFNIIKADGQLFRIYHTEIDTKNYVKNVIARHIFYDTLYYHIDDQRAEGVNAKNALIKATAVGDLPTRFTIDSDIQDLRTQYFVNKNCCESIFLVQNLWGGELLRDNFSIKLLKNMGADNGVLITKGKNLNGIVEQIDYDDVCTVIYPEGYNGITLPEEFIEAKDVVDDFSPDNYPSFNLTSSITFDDAQDIATLRQMAIDYLKIHVNPVYNYKIDMIELSKTQEYKNYVKLETVNLGDIVTVKDVDIDINVKTEVISVTKDLLTGINTKIELGQPLDTIANSIDTIQKNNNDLSNQIQTAITSVLYSANNSALTISTTEIEPIYMGIDITSNTNLQVSFMLYCTTIAVCTLKIRIQLDNVDLPFVPKQKLQIGDNTIGIPFGLPQIAQGAHHIGVFLSLDTSTATIPMNCLQLLVDGRNVQGGISAEPPHAEVEENVDFFVMECKVADNVLITLQTPVPINKIENVDYTIENYNVEENINIIQAPKS